MRWAGALVLALLCSSAQAADPWTPFRMMFPGRLPPVVVTPLPPIQDAAAAIERALLDAELQAAVKRAQEAAERAEEAVKTVETPRDPKSPAPKLKVRMKAPLQLLPSDPDYISCADARRGVTMSCFSLQLNAHIYNSYSEKKKANANACLTEAERKRIEACFQ